MNHIQTKRKGTLITNFSYIVIEGRKDEQRRSEIQIHIFKNICF